MTPYYKDGSVTIYHGDALDVLSRLDPGVANVVCTDPPYSSGARQAAQMRSRGAMRRAEGPHGQRSRWFGSDNMTAHGFAMLVRLLMVECRRVTVRDGHLFSFIDWRQWPVLAGVTEAAGWQLRACLVWDKIEFGMGNGFRQQCEFILHASNGIGDNFLRHDIGTVIRARRDALDLHPTQKPTDVVGLVLSAVPGSVILDPFMGSGTTLEVAKAQGRQCIGIDDKEEYCEIAAKRCSQEVLALGAA